MGDYKKGLVGVNDAAAHFEAKGIKVETFKDEKSWEKFVQTAEEHRLKNRFVSPQKINMAKEYDFELILSNRDYSAIMDMLGMPDSAHMMRMSADPHDNGWILRGSYDDIDGLLQEMGEGSAPKKDLPALRRVREYITPTDDEDDDWSEQKNHLWCRQPGTFDI